MSAEMTRAVILGASNVTLSGSMVPKCAGAILGGRVAFHVAAGGASLVVLGSLGWYIGLSALDRSKALAALQGAAARVRALLGG